MTFLHTYLQLLPALLVLFGSPPLGSLLIECADTGWVCSMIAISLRGGLGNQLFQWALALELQHRRRRVVLDVGQVSPDRGVPIVEVDSSVPRSRIPSWGWRPDRMALFRRTPSGYQIVEEPSFRFCPEILGPGLPRRALLHGYWQSPRYFRSVASVVRSRVTEAAERSLNAQGVALLDEVRGSRSVSVHIRRGDYVANPTAAAFHGVVPDSYYERAFQRLREQGFETFYLFSDDPAELLRWSAASDCHPVSHAVARAPVGELLLMASCGAHVLANSSFSWWGAWMDARESAPVLVPDHWFTDSRISTEDLLLERWSRVGATD
jgi:hypothetical protein